MSDGVFALFGVARRSSVRTIDSFSRTFNMPFVSLGDHASSSVPAHPPAAPSASSPPADLPPHEADSNRVATQLHGAVAAEVAAASHNTNVFMLFLNPFYHRALLDVVKYYEWRKVFYIYDSQEGMTCGSRLLPIPVSMH